MNKRGRKRKWYITQLDSYWTVSEYLYEFCADPDPDCDFLYWLFDGRRPSDYTLEHSVLDWSCTCETYGLPEDSIYY